MTRRKVTPATVTGGASYPRHGSFWTAPRALLLGLPLSFPLAQGVAHADATVPSVKQTPSPPPVTTVIGPVRPSTERPPPVPSPPVHLGGDMPSPMPPTPPKKKEPPCPVRLGGKPSAPRPPEPLPVPPPRPGTPAAKQPILTWLHPHEPHEPCFVDGVALITLRRPSKPSQGDA